MFNTATLAAPAALAPIAVGETTTLGEKLITGPGYIPAPNGMLMILSVAAMAEEIEAQGIEPADVQHFVGRFVGQPGEAPVEAYVTTDDLVSASKTPESIDGIRYTRVL